MFIQSIFTVLIFVVSCQNYIIRNKLSISINKSQNIKLTSVLYAVLFHYKRCINLLLINKTWCMYFSVEITK